MKKTAEMEAEVRAANLFLICITFVVMNLGLASTALCASVVLDWAPSSDTDVAGYKVYYQADSPSVPLAGTEAAEGGAPVDVANANTATISGLDPGRSYYFAVTAYNSVGGESVYSNVVAVTESLPPAVQITSPLTNSAVNGKVSVSAAASDNVGVVGVEFYVNGALLATSTAPPYAFNWDTSSLAPGQYRLSAKAFDAAGNIGESASVMVINLAGDIIPPTVSLSAPPSASGVVTVAISASDSGGVSRIEFYDNAALAFTSNVNPASYNWDSRAAANGTHVLSAKAYDVAGNVGRSADVAVEVYNDTKAPVVAFSSPASNYVYGDEVGICSSASDDVEVTKMELYIDGALQLETSGSSFSIGWTFPIGVHTIVVKAYDAANHVTATGKTINRFF